MHSAFKCTELECSYGKQKNKNQVFVPAVADFDFELSNLYL
jgi:hypothetical protein